jgi:ATP-dependent Zn protease
MQNSENVTSIEIDKETYGLLRSCQDSLQAILRKRKVSYSQVLKVLFVGSKLQETLIDMMLEENPLKEKKKSPEIEEE